MKCGFCRNGETREGTATVMFERDRLILVAKDVPARSVPLMSGRV